MNIPPNPDFVKDEYSSAAIRARREAGKKWRAKNREKIREYNRRYWEKKGLEMISANGEVNRG